MSLRPRLPEPWSWETRSRPDMQVTGRSMMSLRIPQIHPQSLSILANRRRRGRRQSPQDALAAQISAERFRRHSVLRQHLYHEHAERDVKCKP